MSLVQTIIDLLFPPSCPFCRTLLPSGRTAGDGLPPWGCSDTELAALLCSRCAMELPWLIDCCPRCARSLTEAEGVCPHCWNRPVAFGYCCALGNYQGVLRQTMHRFKYGGEKALAVPLGRLLAVRLEGMPWSSKMDILVPVPLSAQRQRTRGYNQSALLAQTLSRKLGIPSQELLQRTRDTDSQTGLGRHARWENIGGAFKASSPGETKLQGRKLLLVDDILTSGATAHAASLALKEAGATQVNLAVIAR